ncbi:hypothetical protein CFP59_09433 [Streptomyces malaysiensis subsp. malaysiensis]|nr:hypothetical protein CFP59_09433 [Streptomyces sp. M56]
MGTTSYDVVVSTSASPVLPGRVTTLTEDA